MIVRTVLAASLLLTAAASAQTYRPATSFPNAPPCPAGASCAAPIACSGHGNAIAGRCNCFPGWAGLSCETPAPVPMACNGHGDMVQGRCICSTSWMGADCSVAGLTLSGRLFRQ
jgi:hypothetical protein